MIIINGSSHPSLAKSIAERLNVRFCQADVQRFEDQELRIQVNADLCERDVTIVQSTCKPANDHLMELLLLIDTARRAGARRITAIIPYFGYGRQDRPSYELGPISASLVARLLESAGVDRVITLDLHSRQIEGFFSVGVRNIRAQELFASRFMPCENTVVVSPDVGGLVRAQELSMLLRAPLAVINKQRVQGGACQMSAMIGEVMGKRCILIDDIVDTAGTLCQAAELLAKRGAVSIEACATHAVLSADAAQRIERSPLQKLYVSDSIYYPQLGDKIERLSTAPLFAAAL